MFVDEGWQIDKVRGSRLIYPFESQSEERTLAQKARDWNVTEMRRARIGKKRSEAK